MSEARDAVQTIAAVEKVVARRVGRDIATIASASTGGLLKAAQSIVWERNPSLAILTGFYIPRASEPGPETDGPLATGQLVLAFSQLGIPIRVATDSFCSAVMTALLRALPGRVQCELDILAADRPQTDVDAILRRWAHLSPRLSHVVSIERVGPALDGRYYNMLGQDISQWTTPLEDLFSEQRVRIAVGDGGNELGMGSVPRSTVAAAIEHGERIACVVPCDHLIVAGVSNWGAWALLAAMACLRPQWGPAVGASLEPALQHHLLATAVRAGAVDGVSAKPEMSVDGLPLAAHLEVLGEIRDLLSRFLTGGSS